MGKGLSQLAEIETLDSMARKEVIDLRLEERRME